MKKEIQAQTFTPVYDELEDRIRLALNYEDIHNRVDFMITRAFILNLLPNAEEFISKHYANYEQPQDNITLSQEQNNVSSTDNTNLELLRASQELLVEVNFKYDQKTQMTLLTLSSKDTVARAPLDAKSVVKIFEVIKSAIPNIRWGISHNF